MRAWTKEEKAWLAENYPRERGDWCAKEFSRLFRPVSVSVIQQKAHDLGIHRGPQPELPKTTVRIRWSERPDMQAWMEEHDDGRSPASLSAMFAEEWGFALSRSQISWWRQHNGRSRRRSHVRERVPVGHERECKGYILVKVAHRADNPADKDNWKLKHVMVWEREHGPVPKGHNIVFADRDRRNFAPENLVAVPRKLVALLNSPNCPEWHDAESLRTAMAWCTLNSEICRAEAEAPRACGVCGKVFTAGERSVHNRTLRNVRTCPECLALGKKSTGKRENGPRARCAVCGAEFAKTRKNQRRCPACIELAPKWSVDLQKKKPRGA